MTKYELPRNEDGSVNFVVVANQILVGNTYKDTDILKAIDANARAETIEACAKLCEAKIEHPADYQGRFGKYGNFMGNKTGPECADAIRNMETPK